MLLHREIPHIPGMRTVLQQSRLLGGRGRKPEPHASTLTTTTDILRRERRFLPGMKTGDLHAAQPMSERSERINDTASPVTRTVKEAL
ncbi:hypothetical protein Airi01_058420 [Actinoallomurus iriomotensis]|uniref:Uncharacterized protein n=1 Tax=Actinoallomurus iriomotensis TaxID=478107 RepID=A0A9W6RPH9_9ACTN|nr:hypothetical protein Airi01_058420 [Actinoallomurus iriomotensis]